MLTWWLDSSGMCFHINNNEYKELDTTLRVCASVCLCVLRLCRRFNEKHWHAIFIWCVHVRVRVRWSLLPLWLKKIITQHNKDRERELGGRGGWVKTIHERNKLYSKINDGMKNGCIILQRSKSISKRCWRVWPIYNTMSDIIQKGSLKEAISTQQHLHSSTRIYFQFSV